MELFIMIIKTENTTNKNIFNLLKRWSIYKVNSEYYIFGKRYNKKNGKKGKHIELLLLNLEIYEDGYVAHTLDSVYFLPKELCMKNTDIQKIFKDISKQNNRLIKCAEKLLDEGDCLIHRYSVFYKTSAGVIELEPIIVSDSCMKYDYSDDDFKLVVYKSGECHVAFNEAHRNCSLYEISFLQHTIHKFNYRSQKKLDIYSSTSDIVEMRLPSLFYYDNIVNQILNKKIDNKLINNICNIKKAYSSPWNYNWIKHYDIPNSLYMICIETGAAELLPHFGNRRNWFYTTVYFPYIMLYSGKNIENVHKSILQKTEYHYEGYCYYEMYHLIKNKFYDGIVQRLDKELLVTNSKRSMSCLMSIAVKNKDIECLKLFLERGFWFSKNDIKYLIGNCESFMNEQVIPLLKEYSNKKINSEKSFLDTKSITAKNDSIDEKN